ncbi:MAG: hypothetical protein ACREX8_15115 [Gammaproteobacteria bacterium]
MSRSQFGSTLPQPGTELEVSVARIDEHKRQVSLRLDWLAAANGESNQLTSRFMPVGWQGHGEVVRAASEQDGRGGFILVRLPEADRPAMLLVKDMTEDLHHDLNNGHVELGAEIKVEVFSVDTGAGKTLLRELPESGVELQAA